MRTLVTKISYLTGVVEPTRTDISYITLFGEMQGDVVCCYDEFVTPAINVFIFPYSDVL